MGLQSQATDSSVFRFQGAFVDQGVYMAEHKSRQLLAKGLYLVLGYREKEEEPFSYLLLRGDAIAQNDLPDYYRFFLLSID